MTTYTLKLQGREYDLDITNAYSFSVRGFIDSESGVMAVRTGTVHLKVFTLDRQVIERWPMAIRFVGTSVAPGSVFTMRCSRCDVAVDLPIRNDRVQIAPVRDWSFDSESGRWLCPTHSVPERTL